jgi:hypothetical protein
MSMDFTSRSILQVAGGRGFVMQQERGRVIITGAHCLPHLPPPHGAAYTEERTYRNLIGSLGNAPTVSAECLFVDPVADIAVLGSPDNQMLSDEAEAYEALVESAGATQLAVLTHVRPSHTLSDGTTFLGPPEAIADAFMFSLDGVWFPCRVRSSGRALWINNAAERIRPGMSGSPVATLDGAIGVVCISGGLEGSHEGGPNPLLSAALPGWLLSLPSARRRNRSKVGRMARLKGAGR